MASKFGGYMGKVIQIDLTTETVKEYPWTDQQRQLYLGGKSMANRILADHLTGTEIAFSEENWVILSTGPLTGTGAPGSIRFDITSLSPKTGLPVSSNCGGNFGVFLKKAGYDAVILRGRCKTHRWLEINETGIRFHDASGLWGTGTEACFGQLRKQLPGIPFSYLCVGPAGEDLLPSATVTSDRRSAGRAGFGAVLGWKKLKAITVSGSRSISVHHPAGMAKELNAWNRHILQNPLTSAPGKISSCPGCPIRCKGKEKVRNALLDDLGLDAMDADRYSGWLQRRFGYVPELSATKKHDNRRDKAYHSILEALSLAEREQSFLFYQDLTEVISALGLCIFTVSTCVPAELAEKESVNGTDLSCLLNYCTGFSVSMEALVSTARESRQMQEDLHSRFLGMKTAST